MKKRLAVVVLLISIIFSVVGCSTPIEPNKVTEPNKVGMQDQVIEPVDMTVVDHLNRTVTVTKPPQRIVSGYFISTSAVIALGLEDKLVGVEAKAKSRPIYSLAKPQLLELPNVGTAKEFDLEGCIALKPDLVILPVKLKDQIKTLEEMGIAVIGVNPENSQLLDETITMIGKLTGTQEYEQLLNYYKEKDNELKNVWSSVSEKPKVYLAGNSDMLSTATKKMYQSDLIEVAGGVNVAGDIEDSYWANISYEQLVQYNPDYIIIVPEAKYTKEDVMNDTNLAGISAIKNNKVYQMPSQFEAWDSPVPSSILGKMWLTSILHEDRYSYDQFVNEVSSFYEQFYDFKVNEEELMVR